MKLSQIGEFGLIEILKKQIPTDKSVKVGIGDDAAVVKLNPSSDGLLTTDMLVEDIHFKKTDLPKDIGKKALSTSLSDVASMGGEPRFAMISLGISPDDTEERIKEIYQGMIESAKEFNVSIVGGDIVKTKQLIINVSLLGEIGKNCFIRRDTAKVGDKIYVSGRLGNSLKSGRHLNFKPRLKESLFLRKNYKISSMIDISDGLAADLGHILRSSKVGSLIYKDKIPVYKGASISNALYDGEDFELLFTLSQKEAKKLELQKQFRFFCIGDIINSKNLKLVDNNSSKIIDPNKGYRHF